MDRVARAGLGFLRAVQTASGRFPVAASGDPALAGECYEDDTPFVTAFLCPALEAIGGPEAGALLEGALGHLVDVAEPPGLWRYWRSADHVLDPDLDDTACASFALRRRHLSILAGANRPAILANRDGRGRFKTWLRPAGRPNDVDSVVNANVVTYLGEGQGTQAAIEWLVGLAREDRAAGSSWYYTAEPASLAYAMARGLEAGVAAFTEAGPALCKGLLARRRSDGSFGSALETAMASSALAIFGSREREALSAAARFLRAAQGADGSWPGVAFYRGPEPPGPIAVYFGSEALTTGLCLEALARTDPRG